MVDNKTADLHAIHFSLYQFNRGFYNQNGWIPLNQITSGNRKMPDVVLPEGRWGSYLENHTKNVNIYDGRTLYKADEKKLNELEQYTDIHKNKSANQNSKWLEKSYSFLDHVSAKLSTLFPEIKAKKIKITLGFSDYGTYGSNSVLDPQEIRQSKALDIQLRLRNDEPLETLAELLVSALVKAQYQESWEKQEAVIDYIVSNILGFKVTGTLDRFSNLTPEAMAISQECTLRFGLPSSKLLMLSKDGGEITFMGKNMSNKLSPYEYELLRLLIKKRYETATFDDIASEIYKTDCDRRFTFWGITKNVQRLRGKLVDVGLPKTAIQNIRGVGFKLNA